MIETEFRGRGYNRTAHFAGLSTDSKPTHNKWLRSGLSTFREHDTGACYLWDGAEWLSVVKPQDDRTALAATRARLATAEGVITSLEARILTLESVRP